MTVSPVEIVLRSLDTSWNYERWEQLPDDGNRYEVIDGVLYMTTAPSLIGPDETLTWPTLEGVAFTVAELFAGAPDTML